MCLEKLILLVDVIIRVMLNKIAIVPSVQDIIKNSKNKSNDK